MCFFFTMELNCLTLCLSEQIFHTRNYKEKKCLVKKEKEVHKVLISLSYCQKMNLLVIKSELSSFIWIWQATKFYWFFLYSTLTIFAYHFLFFQDLIHSDDFNYNLYVDDFQICTSGWDFFGAIQYLTLNIPQGCWTNILKF